MRGDAVGPSCGIAIRAGGFWTIPEGTCQKERPDPREVPGDDNSYVGGARHQHHRAASSAMYIRWRDTHFNFRASSSTECRHRKIIVETTRNENANDHDDDDKRVTRRCAIVQLTQVTVPRTTHRCTLLYCLYNRSNDDHGTK